MQQYKRHASAQLSSLRKIHAGKNLKRLVGQKHHRVPREASAGRLPPPSDRILLSRLYFLNRERSKYICIGLYSERGHRAFFELGGARQAPLVLPPSLVSTLALHLPRLCEHLARGERYRWNEMSFRMQTVAENAARIAFDRTSVMLKLSSSTYV